MKLYTFGLTRGYKCVWMIQELGINCEIVNVNLYEGEQKTEEFLKLNPSGKVPVLEDGDLLLHESTAILSYLADKYPAKNLIPEPRTKERAIYDKWSYFMANELECQLWEIEKNSWFYPEEKRSTQAIENAKSWFIRHIRIIDNELEGKAFILGDKFSVADISLGYLVRWGKSHDLLGETTYLNGYLEKLIAREHYPHHLFKKK